MRGSAAAEKLAAKSRVISAIRSIRPMIESATDIARAAPCAVRTMYHGEPMGHVFHRNPSHSYPVAVAGDGAYLYDREGRRYLDASGGAAVSCLGHSDRAVIDAIQRQLEALPFAH